MKPPTCHVREGPSSALSICYYKSPPPHPSLEALLPFRPSRSCTELICCRSASLACRTAALLTAETRIRAVTRGPGHCTIAVSSTPALCLTFPHAGPSGLSRQVLRNPRVCKLAAVCPTPSYPVIEPVRVSLFGRLLFSVEPTEF